MVEGQENGIYNASRLPNSLSMSDLLAECKRVSLSDGSVTWASEEFLASEKVVGWSELPLWLPEGAAHLKGLMSINCDKAVAAGLSFRPLKDTIKETLAWRNGVKEELRAGLDPDKEKRLLSKLHMAQES
jgi:2'-hydroxyisoflavone reductase